MSGRLITDTLEKNMKNNKILTYQQIEEIYYYLINHYKLEYYLTNILFTKGYSEDGKYTTAEYMYAQKIIKVYKKGLKMLSKVASYEYTLRDKCYKSVFINEMIIKVLIHELKHASHIKHLFESKNYDLEFEILKSTYLDEFVYNDFNLPYLKDYYGTDIEEYYGKDYPLFQQQLNRFMEKLYDFYYYLDPAEINAEYEAIKEIIFINEYLNPDLNIIWKDMLFEMIRDKYIVQKNHVTCTFENFIDKRNKILTLDKFEYTKEGVRSLSFDKRLSYGLPITKREYKSMKEHIMSLHL